VNNLQIRPVWLKVMRSEAEKAAAKCRGMSRAAVFGPEDFESVANEAMVEVLGQYDPDADPVRFTATLRLCVRRRITDYIRSELGRRVGGRADTRSMPAGDDGELIPLRDVRAADPAELAECRDLADGLPTPAEVRVKAIKLKAAVMNALSPEDMTEIIQAQAKKAKAGDTRAARLCLQVVGVSVLGVDQSDL